MSCTRFGEYVCIQGITPPPLSFTVAVQGLGIAAREQVTYITLNLDLPSFLLRTKLVWPSTCLLHSFVDPL